MRDGEAGSEIALFALCSCASASVPDRANPSPLATIKGSLSHHDQWISLRCQQGVTRRCDEASEQSGLCDLYLRNCLRIWRRTSSGGSRVTDDNEKARPVGCRTMRVGTSDPERLDR